MIKDRPAHQVEDWHDISCEYRRGPKGLVVRRQLGRVLIGGTRAGWALFVFCFQDRVDGAWAPARVSVQRWRKVEGFWRPHVSNMARLNIKMIHVPEVVAAMAEFEATWQSLAAEFDRIELAELRAARRAERSRAGYSHSSRL